MERRGLSVVELARSVLRDLDVDLVLERVLESARELTGARYAAVGVLDEARRSLDRFITAGIDEATRRAIGPLPTGRGVLGALIRRPAPLRLDDVGAHPMSYGFPVGHPPMRSFLGVPILIDGQPFGNLYLTEKRDAPEFTADDEEALLVLAQFAGVAVDHARRYAGSEARREELERTVAALDATIQIARAVGGQTNLDTILELVAKRGRALVSARTLVIEQRREGELVVAAAAGELPGDVIGRQVDAQDSVASAAMRTGRSQRIEEEPNRRRFERHGLGRLGFRAQAGLVVPLAFRGQTYGVLIVVDRLEGGPAFTADDQRLLEAFAASAATAVATAETFAAERRSRTLAAAEQERTRWARELHDETLQGLASVRLGLAAALRADGAERVGEAVEDAVRQLDVEITGLRSLITDLRPAALDQIGLEAAIVSLVERNRGYGIDVDLSVDLAFEQRREAERLLPELDIAIYRIVQEALTNARKHGRAARAMVEVTERDTAVTATVRDDGTGFELTDRTDGFGLLGMRERAELLGGMLDVRSAPGEGTTVIGTFPVGRRQPERPVAVKAQRDDVAS